MCQRLEVCAPAALKAIPESEMIGASTTLPPTVTVPSGSTSTTAASMPPPSTTVKTSALGGRSAFGSLRMMRCGMVALAQIVRPRRCTTPSESRTKPTLEPPKLLQDFPEAHGFRAAAVHRVWANSIPESETKAPLYPLSTPWNRPFPIGFQSRPY